MATEIETPEELKAFSNEEILYAAAAVVLLNGDATNRAEMISIYGANVWNDTYNMVMNEARSRGITDNEIKSVISSLIQEKGRPILERLLQARKDKAKSAANILKIILWIVVIAAAAYLIYRFVFPKLKLA